MPPQTVGYTLRLDGSEMELLGFSAIAAPKATYLTAHIDMGNEMELLIEYCLN